MKSGGRGGYTGRGGGGGGGGGGGPAAIPPPLPPISVFFRWPNTQPVIGFFTAFASGSHASTALPLFRGVGGIFLASAGEWRIPITAHAKLIRDLSTLSAVVRSLPSVAVELLTGGPPPRMIEEPLRVPDTLLAKLRDFQIEGVKFIVSHKGRGFIGDEMGCGKTAQALCVAAHYIDAWPLLILAPSSLRLNWKDELRKFLPEVTAENIQIITSTTDAKKVLPLRPPPPPPPPLTEAAGQISPFRDGRVIIIAYTIVAKLVKDNVLKSGQFKIIIADESHLLKSRDSARSKCTVPLLQGADYCVLLSGTPMPSRPRELFQQLTSVNKVIFPDYMSFAARYCAGRQASWGYDDTGQSNAEELNAILKEHILIRRLKKDVLKDLPAKTRSVKFVSISAQAHRILSELTRKLESVQQLMRLADPLRQVDYLQDLRKQQQGLEMKTFAEIGDGKVQSIISYIFSNVLLPLKGKNLIAVPLTEPAMGAGAKRPLQPLTGAEIGGDDDEDEIRGDSGSSMSGGGFFPDDVVPPAISVSPPRRTGNCFQFDALAAGGGGGGGVGATIIREIEDEVKKDTEVVIELDDDGAISSSLGEGKGGGGDVRVSDGGATDTRMDARVEKLIIFAHHATVLNAFEAACRARGVEYVRVDGGASANKKHAACKAFRDNANIQIALLSITAAGVGLSFVAAHRAIFAELYFVPGSVQQAEDRIHRLGQISPVTIEYCVTDNVPGDFDNRLWAMLSRKMNVIQAAIERGDVAALVKAGYAPLKDDDDDDDDEEGGGKQKEGVILAPGRSIFDDDDVGVIPVVAPAVPPSVKSTTLAATAVVIDARQAEDDAALAALLDEVERGLEGA